MNILSFLRARISSIGLCTRAFLRRLKRKGLILKIPHSHRHQLTDIGRRVAVLFTKTYGRVLAPGLIVLDPKLPDSLKQRSPLATAWRQLDDALDNFANRQLLAA